MSDAIDPLAVLSQREREIAHFVANALPNKLIAGVLGIGDDTVRTHLENIATKLHLDPVLHRRVAITLAVLGRNFGFSTFREYRGGGLSPTLETSAAPAPATHP